MPTLTLDRYKKRRPKLTAAQRHLIDFHRRRGTANEICKISGTACWLIPTPQQ